MSKLAVVINPWITDFKLYDEWMHPLGLYFLISLLRHNEWDVQYINCLDHNAGYRQKQYCTGMFDHEVIDRPELYNNIPRKYKRYGISTEEFHAKIQTLPEPDLICIGSGMTYWINGLEATAEIVHKVFPKIPCVIGGISATIMTETLRLRFPYANIFSGPLADATTNTLSIHPACPPLSTTGWHPNLVDAFRICGPFSHGPILTSLGCPMRCTYCASSLLQPRFHFRDHTTILREIEELTSQYPVTDFAFFDDALLFQPEKHFIPLAQQIVTNKFRIHVHAPNGLHIRWLDAELLAAMRACGFITLRFGYESGDVRFQQETSSKTSRTLLEDKVTTILAAGFKPQDIGIYAMGGLPNQSVADLKEEISFIASLKVPVKPVFLTPVPGTRLFDYYAGQFPELHTDPLFHNDTFFITQVPGWSVGAIEEIKSMVRELNNASKKQVI